MGAAPLRVERVPIASLHEDPANVRRHGGKNLAAIMASLRRFGLQKPIVIDGDGIVRAGNGTLAAAKALGWTEIDVTRTSLKGAEATAYAIADNRTGELAEWHDDLLQFEMERDPWIADLFAEDPDQLDEDRIPTELDAVVKSTVWLVALVPSREHADRILASLEREGCKVAIGEHRQQRA